MPTSAVSSFGTLLQIGDGATPTENFTTIAEVLDISGPSLSADTEDVTNHDSAGKTEEVIVTILRNGEITFDLNWIPTHATHNTTAGLHRDYKNRTRRNFKVVLTNPSASVIGPFAAYVIGFETDQPVGGKLGASITLKPTGVIPMP